MSSAAPPQLKEDAIVVTCGMCFNILSDPVGLSCHHHFCLECIRARMERTGSPEGFQCPLCSIAHEKITFRNLPDYVDHNLVNHIVMLTKGIDGRPICQWCDEAVASVLCSDCSTVFCSDCNIAVHKNAAKRAHQPLPITDNRSVKQMAKKCPVKGHEEYKLEFYCLRCEELCCAYCLQVGPHKQHENLLMGKAANEARVQMGRDLEQMGQIKARIESMAMELNRVNLQYAETYDHVESLITDRFAAFKQQLMQKELEVRKFLASLREGGDASLMQSRVQYLMKLNSINEAGMQYRKLQNGGADHEILQNRSAMSTFLKLDVPHVSGTGFRLTDLGDMVISGLNLTLDFQAVQSGSDSIYQQQAQMYNAAQVAAGFNSLPSSRTGSEMPRASVAPAAAVTATPARVLPGVGAPVPTPLRFTFPLDQDVETSERGDGILMRCIARGGPVQVGVRCNETFEQLRRSYPEDNGVVTWKLRLEMVMESFIGVVEKTEQGTVPEGFYWKPSRAGTVDGRAGKPTMAVRSLPACKNGDIVKFSYESASRMLKVAINGLDRGAIVTELHPHVCACIIFSPGESFTLLYG